VVHGTGGHHGPRHDRVVKVAEACALPDGVAEGVSVAMDFE
jgi:hypothetical protein